MTKKGRKAKSKFPKWSVFFGVLIILSGIVAGINLGIYLDSVNPEGIGEITGYALIGVSALGIAFWAGLVGIGCFIILIFVWGK